jgi:hypothetical protein
VFCSRNSYGGGKMKIDELIQELESVREEHGNLDVVKNDSTKILGTEINPTVRNLDIGEDEILLQI